MQDLDADRLAARLSRSEFVRRIVVHKSTGSTSDDARRLAAEGAPEGTVVLAERQTEGRGRLGRAWSSPDRGGLYVSVLLRPTDPPDRLGRYSIAAAVAVCEACREFVGERAVLKWPNDVLAEGRKLAGILAELRRGRSGTDLVLGIGINVHQLPVDFPDGLRAAAISLRMLLGNDSAAREPVAAALLASLGTAIADLRAGAWPRVAERFLRYAPDATGRTVRLVAGGEGSTDGLDASGALRVLTVNGVVLVHASDSLANLGE